jgi:glyceraldehyde-3-phosphate dehydrogenase/erythrose-4-phosphate dehydrogenase
LHNQLFGTGNESSEDKYGVETAFVTMIHAFTYTQNLLDNSNAKIIEGHVLRQSLLFQLQGAMKAIGDNSTLKGKVDGMVFRVHSVGN